MARPNDAAYWSQRMKLMEDALKDHSYSYVENMEQQFRAAQAEVERQIAVWYQRFAANNQVTLADAKRLLTSGELAEFRWTVGEYIAYGQQNAVSRAWMKQLENASARVHISRLEAIKLQIQQQAERLYANQLDFVDSAARDLYLGSYYGTAFELQRGLGVGWTMQAINETTITKVLSRPWTTDGLTFRDRCWTNKQALVNSVNTQLTQMIIRGEVPDKAISAISHQFKVSREKAGRLIMTEAAAFSSAAQRDSFTELGVERFKVVATFGMETCEVCGAMDGEVFKMADYQIGLTAPPFHPWCRCCTCPYYADMVKLGERWTRNPDGTMERVPPDMSFEEWKKKFVVQESDLGDRLRRSVKSVFSGGKVVGFDGLPKEYQQQFQKGLAKATTDAQQVLEREYRKTDYIIAKGKKSYYRPMGNTIEIGIHSPPSTLAHELFHKIDAGGKLSMGLSKSLKKDYAALNALSNGDVKRFLLQQCPEVFQIRKTTLEHIMRPEYRGIADILNGLSGGKVDFGFGHKPNYWKDKGALEAEVWAQFGRIQYENQDKVIEMFRTLLPNTYKDAMLTLKGVV